MITLHLFGKLAKDFGPTISLSVDTPREAVLALSYQSEEYKEHLRVNDWHVMVGEDNSIEEQELDLLLGSAKDVYLVPKIEGANINDKAWIIGSILFPPAAAVYAVLKFGQWMMDYFTPDPAKTADSNASFLFSGPTNSSEQGVSIPRGYGRCLVGSSVISAAIYAESI